eukprot:13037894-Heterocapsa_arctica.AAC.1
MGEESRQRDGCEVTRVTMKNDVTTKHGLERAIKAVQRPNCLLWVAIPCTGGSSWQHMNVTKPGGEERLAEHHVLFQKIWKSFLKVAEACYQYGGKIPFEWPTGCAYWKWPMVIDFVRQYLLNT